MNIRIVGYLLLGLIAGTFAVQLTGYSLPPATVELPLAKLLWRGAGSCSAASCHGGGHPGERGSEYTTWASCDPHARAYQVLFDERSVRIVKNLHGLSDEQRAHPEKVTLCLNCHVAPGTHGEPCIPQLFQGDGVSCESCHGPSQKWLTRHYQASWRQLDPAEKEALGFRPTKDLVSRAKLCVECHVGAGELDVNHDLLAAGHPRLNFEFASYEAIYPKHWCVKDDRARYPDFEARSWALGQAVSAQAALNLLLHRAANDAKPWPEFAEANCYSCHQDLQSKPRGVLRQGLPWSDWYYAELPSALEYEDKRFAPPAELTALRKEMARRLPNRHETAELAGKASAQLEQWLREAAKAPPVPPKRLKALMLEQFARMDTLPTADWDVATQNYLAAAALHLALTDATPKLGDPAWLAVLCQRRKALEFPPGSDSPRQPSAMVAPTLPARKE